MKDKLSEFLLYSSYQNVFPLIKELEKFPYRNIDKLAEMYAETDNLKKTFYYLEQAGNNAWKCFDSIKTEEYYNKLLKLTNQHDTRCRIYLKLGDVYTHIGQSIKA